MWNLITILVSSSHQNSIAGTESPVSDTEIDPSKKDPLELLFDPYMRTGRRKTLGKIENDFENMSATADPDFWEVCVCNNLKK